MARQGFNFEKFFEILDENEQRGSGLKGFRVSAAPGGDAGEQDSAALGSIAMNDTTGAFYKKIANAGALADWEELTSSTVVATNWRPETVRASTNEALSAGVTDPTSWADNDGGLDGTAFSVGEYVYGDYDGTPALWEVTVVGGASSITLAAASDPLADGDTFVTRNHLPDPSGQEDEAIILYNGSGSVKIADVNWEVADAIFLTAGYTAGNGNISASESVNSAIQKLDGNQQDIQSASGLTQGDVDYGSFTGDSLADAQTSKQLFQRVETLLEQLRGVESTGITTETVVDSVPVATGAVKWLVRISEDATPTNARAFEVWALNDGSTGSPDWSDYMKLKVGSNFNATIDVDVSGGSMRLKITSSTAGVTATVRRIEVVESVL